MPVRRTRSRQFQVDEKSIGLTWDETPAGGQWAWFRYRLLGHRSIQHTTRYTQLRAAPFKDFWR
jgi:hypothetical protein